MKIMKDDVNIIKELPSHMKSLDIEAIGSLVCLVSVILLLTVPLGTSISISSFSYLSFIRLLMLI